MRKGGYELNNWMNGIYIFVLGFLAFFTEEIVTFIMLGIILIALTNIQSMLKELLIMKKEEMNK